MLILCTQALNLILYFVNQKYYLFYFSTISLNDIELRQQKQLEIKPRHRAPTSVAIVQIGCIMTAPASFHEIKPQQVVPLIIHPASVLTLIWSYPQQVPPN